MDLQCWEAVQCSGVALALASICNNRILTLSFFFFFEILADLIYAFVESFFDL